MPEAATPSSVATQTADACVPSEADFLRVFLAERDVPCPLCGYNLRALVGDRCPECGDQLVLRVNMAEQRLAAPITGLIALSVGTGFSTLVLIVQLSITLMRQGVQNDPGPIVLCALSSFLGGLAMYFWLRNWRRLRKSSRPRQWLLAAGCWLHPLATIAILIWLIP